MDDLTPIIWYESKTGSTRSYFIWDGPLYPDPNIHFDRAIIMEETYPIGCVMRKGEDGWYGMNTTNDANLKAYQELFYKQLPESDEFVPIYAHVEEDKLIIQDDRDKKDVSIYRALGVFSVGSENDKDCLLIKELNRRGQFRF